MNKNQALTKVSNNKLRLNKAYKKLYKEVKPKKARYVKLHITIPESKGMTRFFKVLFALPIPIWLLKLSLRRSDQTISKDIPIKIYDFIKEGLYRGTFIKVKAVDGTKVIIKTI